MIEAACQFGAEGRLTGIVTQPAHGGSNVACILVSAGLIPKFGPYRLYTQLARRLSHAGFATLRFDLGGIGDSLQEHGALPLRARTAQEIRAAVDYLVSRYALEGVVLCGLCSGAEDSFRYADEDARVRGVVMIDPFCYRTPGWRWRHLRHRLARRTLRALGIYRPLADSTTGGAALAGDGGTLIKYKYVESREARRILTALVARKVPAHFIYTGGVREFFNHPGQLKKMFPDVDFGRCVTLDHLPGMEHTQLLEEDRRTMVDIIGRWFELNYASRLIRAQYGSAPERIQPHPACQK